MNLSSVALGAVVLLALLVSRSTANSELENDYANTIEFFKNLNPASFVNSNGYLKVHTSDMVSFMDGRAIILNNFYKSDESDEHSSYFARMAPKPVNGSQLKMSFGKYEIPLLTLDSIKECLDLHHPQAKLEVKKIADLETVINNLFDEDLIEFLEDETMLQEKEIADFVDYRRYGCSLHRPVWEDCDHVTFTMTHPPKSGGESVEATLLSFQRRNERDLAAQHSYDYCCSGHLSFHELSQRAEEINPENTCEVHVLPIRDPVSRYISALKAENHLADQTTGETFRLSEILSNVTFYNDRVMGWPGYYNANFMPWHFTDLNEDERQKFLDGNAPRSLVIKHIERMDYVVPLDFFEEAMGLMSADMSLGLDKISIYYQDHSNPPFDTTLSPEEEKKITNMWSDTYANVYWQEGIRKYMRMKRDITKKLAPDTTFVTLPFQCGPETRDTNFHVSQSCTRNAGEWIKGDLKNAGNIWFQKQF